MSKTIANGGLPMYRSGAITLNDNDPASLGLDANGNLLVSLVGDSVQIDTEIPAAAALADAVANPTTPSLGSYLQGFNGTTWDRVRTGAQSNVAAATGYLANLPVAQYNSSAPTITDGRYNHLQSDINANLKTTLGTTIAGEDIANDVLKTEVRASFLNITTNATTVVKSGVGVFYGFTVNNNGFTTAGTITIYDNTSAAGTKIGTWTIPVQPPGTTLLATTFFPPALMLNAAFSTGLTFVTATTAPAADITVLYR